MPTIGEVLKQKGGEVATIPPNHTIRQAITELITRKIGSLLVSEDGTVVSGIITERDILRLVNNPEANLDSEKVADYMTTNVICGVPEDDIDYVMSVMTEKRFRRLPVVHEGRIVGLISIGDVVKAMKSAKEYEIRQLESYITGAYG